WNAECGVRNAEGQRGGRSPNDLPLQFRIPHSALRISLQCATATCAASSRTAQHLSSAIFAYGSSTGLVSRLAAASRKWNGTNTWPCATRSEMRHELTMVLRREV